MSSRPALVAHADWSAGVRGRALVVARPAAGGWSLRLEDPAAVPGLVALPGALLGFDAPIGLPAAYARARGIEDFRRFLATLGPDDPLFEPAALPAEVSLERPFYPRRPGGARRARLEAGLGLGPLERALRRACDRESGAACLFWTLGARQCGRAALALWREVLLPALDGLALWPFDGPLDRLLAAGRPVVTETYPGLARRLLGLPRLAKTRLDDRARLAGALLDRAQALGAALEEGLRAEVLAGFRASRDHGLDALQGCLLLLEVVLGRRPVGDPVPAEAARVEGWMVGLDPAAALSPTPGGEGAGRAGRGRSRPGAARLSSPRGRSPGTGESSPRAAGRSRGRSGGEGRTGRARRRGRPPSRPSPPVASAGAGPMRSAAEAPPWTFPDRPWGRSSETSRKSVTVQSQRSPGAERRAHQVPVLGIDAQGSRGGLGAPFCNSSIEMPSGVLMNAMLPSRGGRLMVMPASISFWQRA